MLRLHNSYNTEELSCSLNQLWKQEQFTDCRISCLDGSIMSSKIVLASHSSMLEAVLQPVEVGEILLLDFSLEAVRFLMGILHGEQMISKPTQCYEISELIQALGVQTDLTHIILLESEEEDLENQNLEDDEEEEEKPEVIEKMPVLRRGRRGRKVAETCDTSPKSEVSSLNDVLNQTIDEFVQDVEEEEQMDKQGMTLKRKRCQSPSPSQRKKTGRKPANEKVKLQMAAEYTERYVAPEELESLCSPYIKKSLSGPDPNLSCDLCGYVRREREVLIQHIAVQHMDLLTIKCNICPHLGNDLNKMERHMNTHGFTREKDKVGEYQLLSRAESTLEILEERFQQFQCEFCRRILKSKEDAKGHQEQCGGGKTNVWYSLISNNRFKCKMCEEVFTHKTGLKSHLSYTHNQTLPFVCQDCGDSFITSSMMEFHRRNSHKRRQKEIKTLIGNYHLKDYMTYLPKEDAEPILKSYFRVEADGLVCRVCDKVYSEDSIRSHLLHSHLKLALYKCELCSIKLKDEIEYQNHIQTEHNVQEIKTVELPAASSDTEFLFVHEDGDAADSETNVAFVIHQTGESPSKIQLEPPTNCHQAFNTRTDTVCSLKGWFCSLEKSEELLKENILKPGKQLVCKLCNKEWSSKNFNLAREHIFDHYNLYLYKCHICDTLFKKEDHLTNHRKTHRAEEEGEEEPFGDFHQLSQPVYIPWKQAKPLIDAYFRKDEEGRCWCRLCNYSNKESRITRIHLLTHHLKMNIYQCQECLEEFKLEPNIRKHLKDEHDLEFEGLEKLEDPEYENSETEIDTEDIRTVDIKDLQGKKISVAQGRILRKLHISRNITERVFECQLCGERKESLSNCSDHVMSAHLNVFIYRCSVCSKLLRNWSIYSRHRASHDRPSRKAGIRRSQLHRADLSDNGQPGDLQIKTEYHLLEQDLFVGYEEGMKIVYEYIEHNGNKNYKCKMCEFTSLSQGVETHVFSKHLPKLYLFKCDVCAKMFRYSKSMFKNHMELHTSGKLPCLTCQEMSLNPEKRFTKESLAAHNKRFHKEGEYICKVETCSGKFESPAHLRVHERAEHFLGLPQRNFQYMCQICNHTFRKSSQMESHLKSCQAGRSRTLFRQRIADSLTWEGNGVYSCNMCGEKFEPPRPSTSSLANARKHVVLVHKKTHLRKTKMSWTQGVEGLNPEKKASRRRRNRNLENTENEEKNLDEPTYIIPEQIPSYQEVVIQSQP